MNDAGTFLGTIAQSSAAIVAIIGGFLVSRLVAISSEREGIKRQFKAAIQEQSRLEAEWKPVHDYRLQNSIRTLEERLRDLFIVHRLENQEVDIDEILAERVPRGSSTEEMRPYAKAYRERVDATYKAYGPFIYSNDDMRLTLEKLEDRGLKVPPDSRDLYTSVFDSIHSQLPTAYDRTPFGNMPNIAASFSAVQITPGWTHEVGMRRLDESIRQESELRSQLDAATQAVLRLDHDLDVFAQPVGVRAAIAILALFSLLGIVLPLAFMAFGPSRLEAKIVVLLFSCFVIGLCSTLAYIAWYFRRVK